MKHVVIAIGGTGARVLRSLVYLWASRSDGTPRELLPVLVDTDTKCGSHEKFDELNNLYLQIQREIPQNIDSRAYYFKNRLLEFKRFNLRELIGTEFGQTFKEYVDSLGGIDFQEKINQNNPYSDFISLLYSEDEKKTKINEGFFGNPKIGSMVFSGIDLGGRVFKGLDQQLQGAESITIVGSLHGGTGSTGMMPFLKALVEHTTLGGKGCKKNLILVEPYFMVENNNDDTIQYLSFKPKAEAAKIHYLKKDEIIKKLNAIYLVSGAYEDKTYKYAETAQQNEAHWVELMSARSIMLLTHGNTEPSTDNVIYRLHTHHSDGEASNLLKFRNIRPTPNDNFWLDFAGFSLLMLYLKYEYLQRVTGERNTASIDTESLPLFVRNRLIFNGQLVWNRDPLLKFTDAYDGFLREMSSHLKLFSYNEQSGKIDWSSFLIEQNPFDGEKVLFFREKFSVDPLIDEFLRNIDNDSRQKYPLLSVLNAGAQAMKKLFLKEKTIVFKS
jgi:hypothetical protein